MSSVLKLLASTREARREVAMIRLAAARREFDLAYAACQAALAEVEAAGQWRTELLSRCILGAQQGLRESLLPACEALLQQRQQRFKTLQGELNASHERMNAQRQAVVRCERDVMQLEEWQTLHAVQARCQAARQEELQEQEAVTRQRLSKGRP